MHPPVHYFAYDLSILRLVELANISSNYFRFLPDPRTGSRTAEKLTKAEKRLFFHVAELLCQAVFKDLLPSDGIGLMNLWTKYIFKEQTKYAY